jgi:hypothetical protein
MVRAIKLLARGRLDFHVLFVGGGPHQPAIRRYAAEQDIGHLSGFTGRVSDEELCRILDRVPLRGVARWSSVRSEVVQAVSADSLTRGSSLTELMLSRLI